MPEAAGRAQLLGALIGRIVKRNFSYNFGLTTGDSEGMWERKSSEHLIALFRVVGSDAYVDESTHCCVCVCERVHTP